MSSRRSSQTESTWSEQWTGREEFRPELVSDVSTQAGLLVKHTEKPVYWAKVSAIVFAVILLLAAAFGGGYLVRRYLIEKKASELSIIPNVSWRESICQIATDSPFNATCRAGSEGRPTLLVICLSGFRPDFITKDTTPALFHIKTCGVHAPFLRPVFPTNTFPNQYSIATGLHPESHGIVDDVFRGNERQANVIFDGHYGSAQVVNDPGWWRGEPIWLTAKRQGKRAFTYRWAGSEVTGRRPDESIPFALGTSVRERFDTILNWTKLATERRPDIIMAFIDEPDTTGHRSGTKSPDFTQSIRQIDQAVEQLMQNLEAQRILHCTNILFLSDHGTEDSSCSNAVDVTSVLTKNLRKDFSQVDFTTHDITSGTYGNNIRLSGYAGGQVRLSPSSPSGTVNLNTLQPYMVSHALSCNQSDNAASYSLYNASNIPRRLHYSDNARIEPLLIAAKPGHSVWRTTSGATCAGTTHGSDNLNPNMNGIFLATGPSFRTAIEIPPFSTVELYELMCGLTGLTPADNEGIRGALHPALVSPLFLPDAASPERIPKLPGFPGTRDELDRIYLQNPWCQDSCGRVIEADLRLNISDGLAQKLMSAVGLTRYGMPGSPTGLQIAVLVHAGYVSGYSATLQLTMWAVVTLQQQAQVPGNAAQARDSCARNDVRLQPGSGLRCKDYEYRQNREFPEVDMTYLVPPVLTGDSVEQMDAKIITNIVPMYPTFRDQVWVPLWSRISSTFGGLRRTVYTGPIFDHARPLGVADPIDNITHIPSLPRTDIPLPSHFYMIIIREPNRLSCGSSSNCEEDSLAFILPHSFDQNQHPCQDSVDDFLLAHSATVGDVERISGHSFFPNLSTRRAVRLKTALPVELWWRI